MFYLGRGEGARERRPSEDRVITPEVRDYCATCYMSAHSKTSVRPPEEKNWIKHL